MITNATLAPLSATGVGGGSVLFNMLFANLLLDMSGKNFSRQPITNCSTNQSVCHKIYGVTEEFSMAPPWANTVTRPIRNEPLAPDKIHTTFWLHTLPNISEPKELNLHNLSSVSAADIHLDGTLWVVSHGYQSSVNVAWVKLLTGELLRSEIGGQVVVVDWHDGAMPPYMQAVANVRVVARQLAALLHILQRIFGVSMERVHLIGHSLGAHMSGITGQYMKQKYNITLTRISGLDPAGPYHSHLEDASRLDHTDAHFVDIIHSDNTSILGFPMTVGMMEPSGHVDYYPNGASAQPGCEGGRLVCGHVRAVRFFIDSIRQDCPFVALRCPSYEDYLAGECWGCEGAHQCSTMGLPSKPFNTSLGSRFYLLTNDRSPFCGYHYRVSISVSNSTAAQDHDGEFGILLLSLQGTRREANPIRLSQKSVYYRAGSVYRYIVLAPNIGDIISARITFLYPGHVINPLSWRMTKPTLHLITLTVEMLNTGQLWQFCFDEEKQENNLEYRLTEEHLC